MKMKLKGFILVIDGTSFITFCKYFFICGVVEKIGELQYWVKHLLLSLIKFSGYLKNSILVKQELYYEHTYLIGDSKKARKRSTSILKRRHFSEALCDRMVKIYDLC